MNKKVILFILGIFLTLTSASAQSPVEKLNRTVFNRIEYFFNIQQIDSIYNLASDDFKQSYDQQTFIKVIGDLTALGKIAQPTPVTFSRNTAGYNLYIGNQKFNLQLAVNENYKFTYFSLRPNHIEVRSNLESKVYKQNDLDYFIDSIARDYLKNSATKTLSIGVLNKNTINTFFYGQLDSAVKSSLPNENTVYEIGSITKVFTSILLANLIEEGKLSLEDSIINYLPDSLKSNPYLQKITFKHLANHTSGLPRLPDNFDKTQKFSVKNPYATYSRKDMFHFLKSYTNEIEPGEQYTYSNLGFGLLGELMAIIYNKPYGQLLKEVIATPLGMSHTVDKLPLKATNYAKPHDQSGKETLTWDWNAFAGTGSIKSTLHDMLRFAQYQYKLPESALENAMALTRQFTFYLPPNTDIGLAWNMNMVNDVVQYWHNGATSGSSSFIGLVPDKKSAVIVLSNSEVSVDEISQKILLMMTNLK